MHREGSTGSRFRAFSVLESASLGLRAAWFRFKDEAGGGSICTTTRAGELTDLSTWPSGEASETLGEVRGEEVRTCCTSPLLLSISFALTLKQAERRASDTMPPIADRMFQGMLCT